MFVAAVTVGGVFLARVNGVLSAFFVLLGTAVWAVFFIHFRSIGYTVENGVLIIRSGFLVNAARRISISDILWQTTVKFGSVMLFSVTHTAAGRAVIFAPDELLYGSRS